MTRREATAFVVIASLLFVASAAQLGLLCLALSPVALAIVFWYSLAKRYTSYTQLFLGLAMAVAPVGGWIAAGGRGGWEPWVLGLAIGTWVGGFDVLYACQDVDVDRREGLRSIPVRFGVPRVIVAVVTITLTVVASVILSPLVAIAMFVGVPGMLLVVRWYLKRATPAYQRESASYAALNGTITESVEGARTVDALRLGPRRQR